MAAPSRFPESWLDDFQLQQRKPVANRARRAMRKTPAGPSKFKRFLASFRAKAEAAPSL
jgi:hypothetical protein